LGGKCILCPPHAVGCIPVIVCQGWRWPSAVNHQCLFRPVLADIEKRRQNEVLPRATLAGLDVNPDAAQLNTNIDIETCERCAGQVKIIACIEDPAVIDRILAHLNGKVPSAELAMLAE
jgi:hypothetical protein